MGTLYTPLTNTPILDWGEKPDVPAASMAALSVLERYGNVPVASATARETAIPSANRYVGQVTYNQATDTFEYWTGTVWRKINQVAALPGSAAVHFTSDVVLTANKYHDFLMNLNVSTPGIGVLCFWRANVTATVAGTTYQSAYLAPNFDGVVGGYTSRQVLAYPNQNAALAGDLTSQEREFLTTGPHTIGCRITAGFGTVSLTISDVQLMAWQISGAATAGQSGVTGTW